MMGGQFDSNGGEQNIAQGDHAIGKQVNVTQSVHGNCNIFSGTGNVTVNGIPSELFAQYVRDLGVTDSALASFFKILEEQQIPRGDLDSKLREIAFRYKELLLRFEAVTSDDPQVKSLKEQARQAIEDGDYDQADALLNQAKERDQAAVAMLKASLAEQQAALEKRQLSEAASCAEQAKLQEMQYRYKKAAEYWQEAASALPEDYKGNRADCLGSAGVDLWRIAHYAEALSLYKQSLSIFCEIGDLKEAAKSLNNISQIYEVKGGYQEALDYLEQSLSICRELGDKKCEGVVLNNIAAIAYTTGDNPKALHYLKQSLPLRMEINDKEGEGSTLNNIGIIHHTQGDDAAALQYFNQALTISREINDRATESKVLGNMGLLYDAQENYDAALEYAKQELEIDRQISDRRDEGNTLDNIAKIYEAKGDYAIALKHYEQALAIAKEIGDKEGEAVTNKNIGGDYILQDEMDKAELYLSQATELMEQLEHRELKITRQILEAVRAKLRGEW